MKNKSLLMTMACFLFAMTSTAQPVAKPKEPEVKKNENKTSDLLDFSAFEGKYTGEIESFTDARDGKIYKTVKIGTQPWMAENLAYKATSGCWANKNEAGNVETYGYLYNWYAAKTACPSGWHLPSDAEWQILIDFSGGKGSAGGNLKETGTAHWEDPNQGAANLNGFTALPGGYRNDEGEFSRVGTIGFWWSSNEALLDYAIAFRVEGPRTGAVTGSFDATFGYSVRCIKDE